jgi:hypothetical protein
MRTLLVWNFDEVYLTDSYLFEAARKAVVVIKLCVKAITLLQDERLGSIFN